MIYPTKRAWVLGHIQVSDVVLDVGFVGQGIGASSEKWLHRQIKEKAKQVYGVDLVIPDSLDVPKEFYKASSAENFSFDRKFDVIVAGDLIEHLSNPGMFLINTARHLNSSGTLLITTPNAFNIFNIAEKFSKDEPTVNCDHVCYFNRKTLQTLLKKNGFRIQKLDYILSLEIEFSESWKKKVLNIIYRVLGKITPKFSETIAIVAVPYSLDK